MSLLMDALRKAEQEKRAAAEKLREKQQSLANDETSHHELKLSEAEKSDSQATESESSELQSSGSDLESPEDSTVSRKSYRDLTLTPLEDTASKKTTPDKSQDAVRDDGTAAEDVGAADYPENDDESETQTDHNDNFIINMSDDTGTLEGYSDRPVEDDTLIIERHQEQPQEETLSAAEENTANSRTYRDRSASTSSSMSQEREGNQFSPASAQNIFAARKSSAPSIITAIILVVLIIIGLGAAGVFYYFSVAPTIHDVVSPRVAQEMESPELPDMAAPGSSTGIDQAETQLPENDFSPVVTDNTSSSIKGEIEGAIEGLDATNPEASEPEVVQAEAAVGEPESSVDEAVESTEKVVQKQPQEDKTVVESADEELELKPALLQISRTQNSQTVNRVVNDAFRAYKEGNLSIARQLYESALEKQPNSRHALLGLAAIAVQENQLEKAYQHYLSVLQQNPADRAANAGLMSIQQKLDPAESEARIIRMIEEEPQAAYLYQALGHIYAEKERWPQAQKAYFDAFSRDNTNPDYAYNLAVSLEHLGQPSSALNFYKRALDLSTNRPAQFSRELVQSRIDQISTARISK